MEVSDHGGECCGVSHIFGFGSRPSNYSDSCNDPSCCPPRKDQLTKLQKLDDIISKANRDYPKGRLYEVALTVDQTEAWHDPLTERGFFLGPRFLNQNSGNAVQMYYYRTGPAL